ncbi:MAG: glycosyltransferase, partial [Candidatus Thermoplasmatota archaeon]
IYSNASVFVCPSIYEPFGIIVLEAMACELPVVATNVGGIKETMIDRKTGYLVEPNNALQLADAVNEILDDKNLANEMGIEGRKRALEFSWENVAKKTLNVYKMIL